ncbi:glycoside hydrolase family 5 protein [Exidia glandulosa HHB12029]|uniref:cellulase n=1 Tax=Exidia glandulosa HHB12029 TaxID=1314781 RepID=A0A165NPN3_EXIGL|nr:glycoside hydrolase family 5 protein [Exidia glandulosa HHB12029]
MIRVRIAFSTALLLSVQALGPLGGVNNAGFDFGVATDGSFSGSGVAPPTDQFAHFASQGVNLFRIPFAWQLATPSLGGTLDAGFLGRYDPVVNAALATGAYVIVDLHNYARWNGAVINQGGPTLDEFASVWTQLASHFKDQPKIIFGVMNEPHDLPDDTLWPPTVQAAINAIRAAGATSQNILIPGSTWSAAGALRNGLGPALLNVTDPAGTDKIIFDVHAYLDEDFSGTHTNCVTDKVGDLQSLSEWLAQNGRQAILSETGGGRSDESCFTALGSELAFVRGHPETFAGFAVWSAGAFSTTYELSVVPNDDGSDAPVWINAVKPNLPAPGAESPVSTDVPVPGTTATPEPNSTEIPVTTAAPEPEPTSSTESPVTTTATPTPTQTGQCTGKGARRSRRSA